MDDCQHAAVTPPEGPTEPPHREAPPLALRGVIKRWPKREEPVLDGIDLTVESSTVVAIHGRNGAGKTTLLRLAAGILVADEGHVTAAGIDAEDDRREFQRRIGFVSAGNGALYGRLTVDHHLDLTTRLALLPGPVRATASASVREEFALDELAGRRVDRLSTGQRQRLRLALAFVHRPKLLLLDEPDASLDDEAVALLAGALERVRERGGAAIVCSPSGFGDRIRVDRSLEIVEARLVGP